MPLLSLDELRRRKFVQWMLAYLAAAWLLLQVVALLAENYAWPPTVMRTLPVLLGIGALAAAIVAWYHGEKGAQRVSAVEIGMLLGVLILAAAGVSWARQETTSTRSSELNGAAAPPKGSIAILPFVNSSSDVEQEFFADGLTDELLNILAQIPELRVAARTSAFAFKGVRVPVDSIGRALNVAHVLNGSVRRSGDRLRVTAQLVRTDDGFHVWSDSYDRELRDVFALQDDISRAIANALRLELGGAAPAVATATDDIVAHTNVLRARELLRTRSRESMMEAERLLNEAIELDPRYAAAHAALAETYQYQAYFRQRPVAEGYQMARDAAREALRLDPGNPDAHTVLGRLSDMVDWDFAGAIEHFDRALDRNPSHEMALAMSAWVRMRLGQKDAAIATARRAVELNPLSASAFNTLGAMYSYAGRPLDAIESYRAALTLEPGDVIINANMAVGFSGIGDLDAAARHASIAFAAQPEDPFAQSIVGYVAARRGERQIALQWAEELQRNGEASPYDIAVIYAGLGDHDRAFHYLERAVEQHDDIVGDLGVDPIFDDLRGDPRMSELLRRMGLPTDAEAG